MWKEDRGGQKTVRTLNEGEIQSGKPSEMKAVSGKEDGKKGTES